MFCAKTSITSYLGRRKWELALAKVVSMNSTNVRDERSAKGSILIVGGTGEVGRATARTLLALLPDCAHRLILSSRDEARARAVAAQLHPSAQGRRLDVATPAGFSHALEGVGTVVLCVELPDAELARACLMQGIHVVETSASVESLRRLEVLDGVARSQGAQVILSVGLAPGLTNLLAAYARRRLDSCERIEIDVLIGAGDTHGEGAIDWTLGRLAGSFEVVEEGVTRRVRGFSGARTVTFAGEVRSRRLYRFDFSDQHTLRRTVGVPNITTALAVDSRALTAVVAFLAKTGLTRVLASGPFRKPAARLAARLNYGSPRFHVQARAYGRYKDAWSCVRVGVSGEREAEVTGRMTALAVQLIDRSPTPGVAHLDQLMTADEIFPQLEQWGYALHDAATPSPQQVELVPKFGAEAL